MSGGTTQKLNNYFGSIYTFTHDLVKAIDAIEGFCDIVPPVPSLSFFMVNLPAYIMFLVTAPLRFPLCLLIGELKELECPQCVLYNLFPFLSILNLFTPPQGQNCMLFGCACPTCATCCAPTSQQSGYTFSSITQIFTCNGQPCPPSWLNYLFCLLGYTFLVPFTPFIYLINLALDKFLHTQLYFSFNCPVPQQFANSCQGGSQ